MWTRQSAAADIELLPFGARVRREKNAPDEGRNSGDLAKLLPANRTRTRVSLEFSIVGICHRIQPTFSEGMSQINFTARTPVDEFHTRAFGWQARNYLLEPENDAERIRGLQEAIAEDLRIVEKVRPRLMPPSLPEEFLTKADSMEVAFRRLVREWAERGWEIDSDRYMHESQLQSAGHSLAGAARGPQELGPSHDPAAGRPATKPPRPTRVIQYGDCS